MRSKSNGKPLLCLFGPTASGKTDLLLSLFGSNRAEVISADSMQIYRGMDIGTAKPSPRQRERITHHLIDIRDPDQPYHVADFVRSAELLIDRILAAGKLPVVCGGTAFYMRTLLCGLPQAPPSSDEVRRQIQQRLEAEGAAALHRELAEVDPESAGRIAPADRYRVARALEIYQVSGRPRSHFARPVALRDDFAALVVAIDRARDDLYQRINARVVQMFRQGLVAEVERLVASGYRSTDPGLRAIGYREFFEHPDVAAQGPAAARDARVAEAIRLAIARDSRRYAKRQMTYIRAVPWLVRAPAGQPDRFAALVRSRWPQFAPPR